MDILTLATGQGRSATPEYSSSFLLITIRTIIIGTKIIIETITSGTTEIYHGSEGTLHNSELFIRLA